MKERKQKTEMKIKNSAIIDIDPVSEMVKQSLSS